MSCIVTSEMTKSANHEIEVSSSQISRACQGEQDAVREIFDQYYFRVVGFVRRYVDDSDIEDVTQEIFFRVFRNASEIQELDAFESYLFQAAKNHCINWLRKKYRVRKALELYWYSANVWRSNIEQEKKFSDLDTLLQMISSDSRQYIELFYVYKYSRSEIAAQLNQSTSTVYRKLAAAKTELLKQAETLSLTIEFDGRHDLRVEQG